MLIFYSRILVLVALLSPLFVSTASAQVVLAPTAVFIDSQSRFGSFIVMNASDQAQEIGIDFVFGYPDTDTLGNVFINYQDEVAAGRYSIGEWVRAFPRSFRLNAGERQVVRLNVRPPTDLADGMYWTRVKVTSNAETPAIETEVGEGVSAQIGLRFEQITAAFYPHGQVSTGLAIEDVDVNLEDGRAVVMARIDRMGNAPFLGTATLTIADAAGTPVRSTSNTVAIYKGGARSFGVDVSGLTPGRYTAEVRFEARRTDIPSENIVRAEPVAGRTTFEIR
jgi:hypothetical protein